MALLARITARLVRDCCVLHLHSRRHVYVHYRVERLGHNAPIWIGLLLAGLAPTLVHRCDPRRRKPTFRSKRRQCAPNDYRSAPALTTIVDAQAFAANVRAFSWRLAGATSFCAVACYELWTPIFWVQTGCVVWPNTFCFTEYMAYLLALLVVVLVHAPTWRSVFGSPRPR